MKIVDLFVLACMMGGVTCSALVAFHPNILYAAVALIGTLLSVAGLYGALGADFLAGAQLIIYVGGVIVVILFAVMMSEDIYRARFVDGARRFIAPFIASAVILYGLLKLITSTPWPGVQALERGATAELIGRALVGPYALVFQYVAIVLLSGLIGAVIVARPRYDEDDNEGRA